MSNPARKITLGEWDQRYHALRNGGIVEPPYGGPLARHAADGDSRLEHLLFDDSPAALRLWNFLLTEEDRLREFRERGGKLVGAMKDLGTVPVMVSSLPGLNAFYPDGAWWTPCVMETNQDLLKIADSLGLDESFCPVRAMVGAFVNGLHFPIPDLLTCSVGAVCDDFSAIAQRLEASGHSILWWEIPPRRPVEPGEEAIALPGGFRAAVEQVRFVERELARIRRALEDLSGHILSDDLLAAGIREANRVRICLKELRRLVFTSPQCPLPALEMQIAEMLAIHFCSDRAECLSVLEDLLSEVSGRAADGVGVLPGNEVRVFWVNPVADLRAMNLLEESGGRLCGTDFLFSHALDEIPQDISPMEALARMALADPMVGPASDRAARVCRDIVEFGAEAVVISRIPGASHCATEGEILRRQIQQTLGLPVAEIEVSSVCDSAGAGLRTRLEALIETVRLSR